MTRSNLIKLVTLWGVFFTASLVLSANQTFTEIPDSNRQMIEKAMPETATVIPQQKRKLLVFTLNIRDGMARSGHPSIPFANYALERLGETTGAWQVTFSNDTLLFTPEKLGQFDAVCFNNTVGVLVENSRLRNSLLDYIWQGGGFVGIHAAAATFVQYPVYDQFPEFGIMLGGYENGGHPWKPNDWITLKVDDPANPVNATFSGNGFRISDEVFQFREHYTRDKLRVLLSIDTTQTDMSTDRYILPERRMDGDLAISWIRRYGRGRVFYTSLGHNAHINWNAPVLKHYLAGIQYALGDLDAATTPSGKLTPAEKAREALNWQFALTANTLQNHTLFDAIDKTAELGLVYLDAVCTQKVSDDLDKPFDQNLTDDEIRMVRNKLQDAGVQLTSWYIPDMPKSSCKNIFEFAKKMAVATVISGPDAGLLDTIGGFCEQYNVRLALINRADQSPYSSPRAAVEMINSPYIGVCGDVRQWVKAGIVPAEAVKILGSKLFALRVHDTDKNGNDVPWARGNSGLKAMFQALPATGQTPVVIGLEYKTPEQFFTMQLKQCVSWFDCLCSRFEVD